MAYNWEFGEEWAGTEIKIKDADGNVIDSFIVPEGGQTYNGTITGENLNAWDVTIDGVSIGEIADDLNRERLSELGVERVDYGLAFDKTYEGYEWQVRRTSDGSVAASGPASAWGAVSAGKFTIGGSDPGEIWVRAPAGDGQSSEWIPTGITRPPQDPDAGVYYSYVNNPDPAPVATPAAPNASPAPSPGAAPGSALTTNTVSVGSAVVATNDVEVNVDELQVPESNDGEENVLGEVVTITDKMRTMFNDFRDMFANVALTYDEFNKIAFGGVGTECTLNFGPITLQLAGIVPGFVRNGLKLVILLTVLFGAIRMTWDTFTSY